MKTWVRDIKEKREVYGISQQKLAIAAGITRPYLSDIETGKAHPSEALQETITEALERFNPDNPLEMLFDYVGIRFPTTDVRHIVEDVLQLKLDVLIHEDYGFYSYTEHYVWVMCSFWYHRKWKKASAGTERQRLSADGKLSAGTASELV